MKGLCLIRDVQDLYYYTTSYNTPQRFRKLNRRWHISSYYVIFRIRYIFIVAYKITVGFFLGSLQSAACSQTSACFYGVF